MNRNFRQERLGPEMRTSTTNTGFHAQPRGFHKGPNIQIGRASSNHSNSPPHHWKSQVIITDNMRRSPSKSSDRNRSIGININERAY